MMNLSLIFYIYLQISRENKVFPLFSYPSVRQTEGRTDRQKTFVHGNTYIVIQKMDRHTVNRENTAVVTCTDSGYTNREPADKGHLDRGKRTSDRRQRINGQIDDRWTHDRWRDEQWADEQLT